MVHSFPEKPMNPPTLEELALEADWKQQPTARISRSILDHLRSGEPWVFAEGVTNPGELRAALPKGGWVRLGAVGDRQAGGLALFDPANPIALRVVDAGREPPPPRPLVRRRTALAWAIRSPLLAPQAALAPSTPAGERLTNGVRLIHGEGDRLPGLTADYYAGLLVLRPDCAAWLPFLAHVVDGLADHLTREGLPLNGVWLKGEDSAGAKLEGWVRGQTALPHRFVENGHTFLVDPSLGQKTGFFLDMRPNRAFVGAMSRGLTVLNGFSYTGGFGVYALKGGARRVVHLDSSPGAMEAARANTQLAGFPTPSEDFVVGDVFEYMEAMEPVGRKETGPFDLLILDPPSFAHSQKAVPAALKAYLRLNTLALERLGSGQFLATASCSSRVSPADFNHTVEAAAKEAGRRLRLLVSAGAGPDHPQAPGSGIHPYLKFLYYMVE